MKTSNVLSLAIAASAFFSLSSLSATESPKSVPSKEADLRVEVAFQNPDSFADAKDSSMDTEKGRASILEDIKSFMETTARKYLAPGQKVSFTFTEVDLAGEYEPWRTGTNRDVRIVKDIYPPRFDITYKITDSTGAVVKEGKDQLRDLGFMSRLVIDRNDPLRYEKDMLRNWMYKALQTPKK
jgi:hypothetical protein